MIQNVFFGSIEIIELDRTLIAQPAFSGSSWAMNQAQSFPRHRACFSSISERIPESLMAMTISGHMFGIPAPLLKIISNPFLKHYKVLEKFSVTPINAVGNSFDPAFHQAIQQEETDAYPDNTVVQEFQKGYMIHDRLLRPSMVIVSKGTNNGDNEK